MEREAYETATPRAHTIIFQFPWHAVLLFQQYFLLKNFREIVTNLLEDLLRQGRACIVVAKHRGPPVAATFCLLRRLIKLLSGHLE